MEPTMIVAETESKIAYIRVVMVSPDSTSVIETHAIPHTGLAAMRKRVKDILGQWMEPEDKFIDMESSTWATGETCKPFTIFMGGCYETSDIFAQLITA